MGYCERLLLLHAKKARSISMKYKMHDYEDSWHAELLDDMGSFLFARNAAGRILYFTNIIHLK